jgi:MOB kinase activator 1
MQGLQLKRHIEATLGTGNMIDAVALPQGEALDEWLAVNMVG